VETPCLLLSGKQIRRVSCGNGYCLMTSIFGAVFSMGYNQFGQLGLGHSNNGEENMSASQICKFTNSASPFIVDVQATVCGASFAIT
jgi:alpha-tubulin suppressor-like RCC1 family protein